jgi:hypothetical protein
MKQRRRPGAVINIGVEMTGGMKRWRRNGVNIINESANENINGASAENRKRTRNVSISGENGEEISSNLCFVSDINSGNS